MPQALGSPVPGGAGGRVPLEQHVGRAGHSTGGCRAGQRLGLGQHEGVAAVTVLHAVVAPAAAALQSPALGSGSAQSRRGTGQGHEAEAERPHGAGVPVGPGCHGGGCSGSRSAPGCVSGRSPPRPTAAISAFPPSEPALAAPAFYRQPSEGERRKKKKKRKTKEKNLFKNNTSIFFSFLWVHCGEIKFHT